MGHEMSSPGAERAADPAMVRAAVARVAQSGDVRERETHISRLFLTRDRAFKLKKPLTLDFLDYGTPARRKAMSLHEVRLNSRLAPSVYLGVRALVPGEDGLEFADADASGAIDYVVEMRLYDEDQTLSAVIARGDVELGEIEQLGRTLADFHAQCLPARVEGGAARALSLAERNLSEFPEPDRASPAPASLDSLAVTRGLMRAFARRHGEVVDRRAERGLIRECHGDLRAEHVIVRPELTVVDCVEFAPELRTLDVADDLAFLVMDLAAHDSEWVSPILVTAYRDAGGDCGADTLVSFFAVHRALVRAKIQLVRAAQHPSASEQARTARDRAADFIVIAERFGWRSLAPLALAVCGGPATGKSFLAGAVADRAGALMLNSDVVRKELAGLRPQERAPAEVYSPDFSRRTYRELGRRAALALDTGPCVVLDATFRRRDDRAAFSDGFGSRAPVVFVECLAPPEVVAERARARELDPDRVSDATVEIAEREGRRWEPLDEIEPGSRVALRTDRDVGQVIAELVESLERCMAQEVTEPGSRRSQAGRAGTP